MGCEVCVQGAAETAERLCGVMTRPSRTPRTHHLQLTAANTDTHMSPLSHTTLKTLPTHKETCSYACKKAALA